MKRILAILKDAAGGYLADNCLSRGAAIAYYTVFSMSPVLVIVIAVAGTLFGEEAARGAIVSQLGGLMGKQAAEALQAMIASAGRHGAGPIATVIGIGTLLITASGVFGEIQATLNVIWRAEPPRSTVGQLVRVRLLSLGLVMTMGFLLMVSLVASAVLAAIGDWLDSFIPETRLLLQLANAGMSFFIIALIFGATYKILPDRVIAWRDVGMGAVTTALLFSVGKMLIGMYIGSSNAATSYGAAGALVIMLLWVYYSAQIFLFGAELTRAYSDDRHARRQAGVAPDTVKA
ncbi:YihY/virulence factor BrkB family protein [Granulibacter bethesdensis]|uniref:Ribonuclease BN n=2 Tax=Granulibacter bethesdensis TaxID=364410 RepID=Q0BPF8_GRABC|nr:YihY/virulence factor BrkB family protein [Granulibacter bethesdensis]ABI63294.1 Ribonuclease BN [Granulibacter bethesdensis CGDNIH1]AHJ64312.1 Ribonuclease BN [Granulibacter bethesdensis]AHJ66936.1 Ribonuclease BN [Granulibacter bethesdensis CGDNIH4]AHJ69605.1 Ribonuclease BN [Granulibacter bethesdensis]APH53178.1 Ribonuclease BN [Granulibacter bethesdensis]